MPSPKLARYQVLGRLAEGGMAEVWLARAQGFAGFEKLVVLKTILPSLLSDPQFVEMFVNEARVAAMLNHPNCVQIFELGKENDVLYIAMEYIEGFALSRVLHRATTSSLPPALDVVLRVACDALGGLEHAHEITDRDGHPIGLIHRDVSPDNLLLGFTGQTKLVDFGIAKAAALASNVATRAGTVKGKFGYVAPEYLLSESVDGRADLFALGVVLYRTLTGKRPFTGRNASAIAKAIVMQTPPPPHLVDPRIPVAVSDVVMRALAKEPDARFASAREMRAALEAAHRPARHDDVAAYMGRLWPRDSPERVALGVLSSGRAEQGSGPILDSVVSQDLDLPEDALHTPNPPSRAPNTPGAGLPAWPEALAEGDETVRAKVPLQAEPETRPNAVIPPPRISQPRLTPVGPAPAEATDPERTSPARPAPQERDDTVPRGAVVHANAVETAGALTPIRTPVVPQRPSRPELLKKADAMASAGAQTPAVARRPSQPVLPASAETRPERLSRPDMMATVNAAPSPDALRALRTGEVPPKQPSIPDLFITVGGAPNPALLRDAVPGPIDDEPSPPTIVERPKIAATAPANEPDDNPEPPRSRRTWLIAAGVLLVLGTAFFVGRMRRTPAAVAAPPAPVAAPVTTGSVTVDVGENVTVFDGDKELGRAPGPFELEAGERTLRVFSREEGIDQKFPVTVTKGETAKLSGPLRKGTLSVRTTPWAFVKLDGRPLGTSPIKPRDVYEGAHLLELYNSELGVTKRIDFTIQPAETRAINAKLTE